MGLKEKLEFRDGTKEMVKACLEVVKSNEKIVLFGAGVGGGGFITL